MRSLPVPRFPFSILLFSIFSLLPRPTSCAEPPATLDDLKKLEIICYVPSWLPKGFRLRRAEITYDEPGPDEDKNHRLPLYSIEYGNGPTSPRDESGRWADRTGGATFTIESAREGIGDRNIMETEDAKETTIPSLFGPMYLIFAPKGKGESGQKVEIKANWASDSNMKSEKAKNPHAHPVLGRYHGFSATAITVAEFAKIINSLHPVAP
ncbi:MAG: hypothetical protein QOC70_198 [Verrucomicrobiota bacterium]|jgi:hypothetical protein